ncbi:MAG: N-acetylmuramoyl-L-alanine amidase [Myxococcaceae bacterium]|nr:N-acetylmuramoyl-L-alanine amidase [Myxococcaceae bacterium]MBH2006669.1 N-acetylmuramoyl-L-alanine amidase [Myxococcaceae bacterium]
MFAFLLTLAMVSQIESVTLHGSLIEVEANHSVQVQKTVRSKDKTHKKRLIFDLKPAKLGPQVPRTLISKQKQVAQLRIAQHNRDTVRIVSEVSGNPKLSLKVKVSRPASKAKRSLSLPQELSAPEPASSQPESTPFKALTIVIDPGHGGDDPGAIGRKGLREKDITLAVSKRLKLLLERDLPGTQVYLTRETDKTLSLPERTQFANSKKADLFLSVHVNASLNRSTQGVETYYLNTTHDRYALRLAARENAMTESETSNLEYILADLAMKSSVSDSVKLGNLVQNSLCTNLISRWNDTKNLGLKSALFYVLMGAKMPAILIETAFISNSTDEKRLKQDPYQHALAEGIVKGIQRFTEERVAQIEYAKRSS